ncbi:hypothetical protein ACFL6B_04445 [Thermodesulfobacteriota bacterium]
MKLKTIEQRRKTDRERQKRWRMNKLAAGNKPIQLMITPEAQAVLKQEKDRTGEPFVSIIHRAIIGLKGELSEVDLKKQQDREPEQQAIHDMILKMDQEGKDEWQISRILNEKGVPTWDDKGEWYPSTIRSFLKSGKH